MNTEGQDCGLGEHGADQCDHGDECDDHADADTTPPAGHRAVATRPLIVPVGVASATRRRSAARRAKFCGGRVSLLVGICVGVIGVDVGVLIGVLVGVIRVRVVRVVGIVVSTVIVGVGNAVPAHS